MATKKEGMMGKAIRSLNSSNVLTGIKPLRVKEAPASKPRMENRNKASSNIPKTSPTKAAAQKEAIRKRVAAKVAAKKKKAR